MDREKVRDAIDALYQGAGIQPTFSGEINDQVAAVFGRMLAEVRRCSDAFAWIPVPSGGRATVAWLARNLARGTIDRMRDSRSLTCARHVIYIWDRELRAAGMGL